MIKQIFIVCLDVPGTVFIYEALQRCHSLCEVLYIISLNLQSFHYLVLILHIFSSLPHTTFFITWYKLCMCVLKYGRFKSSENTELNESSAHFSSFIFFFFYLFFTFITWIKAVWCGGKNIFSQSWNLDSSLSSATT